MRFIVALLALGLAMALQASVPAGSIEEFAEAEMAASGAPGLAYAVVDDGEIRVGAHGEIVQGSGLAITPNTPFVFGSISKSFTALAVMQLVETGAVELDAGIGQYLEAFADRPSGAITVRQLLGHTSGFSTLQGNQGREGEDSGEVLAREAARIAHWTPAYAPGARWEYSNANYQLLGALVEAVSGRDYADYVEAEILAPVGMEHSFVADGAVHDEIARGHVPWFFGHRARGESRTERASAPQGGVIGSARDLALYLAMMMNGEDDVLSAEGKAEMMRPASEGSPFYGLGWFLDTEQGTVGHSGSTPGTETLATMLPDERRGVLVLVNAGSGIGFGETAALRNGITARALGLDYAGEGSRWQQKGVFVLLVALPFVFAACMAWAWRKRAALRAKRGTLAGRFSLWFPLLSTLVMAWALVDLIPRLFGASPPTLRVFQPDFMLAMTASAATGVAWAVLRLTLAHTGGPKP